MIGTFADDAKVFYGSSNSLLATKVANRLKTDVGKMTSARFSDGEVRVEIHEHVRGKDIYIVQSTCPPVNDTIMELLVMVDAFKRSGARSITAVVPYYGYARQDRRPGFSRVPISSKLVAETLQHAGVNQIIVVELHSSQQQGFFNIPVIDSSSAPIIAADIYSRFTLTDQLAIVAPDAGGVARARVIAKILANHNLVIIDKRRPEANKSEIMNVIGDVENKVCIIIDDLVDTAGTLCRGAKAIKNAGAKSVYAYCTHPVLSGDANLMLSENKEIDELVVTDSIPVDFNKHANSRIRQISIADLLAETIRRVHNNESVSSMYV